MPSKRVKKKTETPTKELESAEDDAPRVPKNFNQADSGFKTQLSWGVKDRAGEWIRSCITKSQALETFAEDRDAYQLIEGCDPWACLDDSPETLTVRRTKDEPATEAVPGTPSD